jgi:hypothetical protein
MSDNENLRYSGYIPVSTYEYLESVKKELSSLYPGVRISQGMVLTEIVRRLQAKDCKE